VFLPLVCLFAQSLHFSTQRVSSLLRACLQIAVLDQDGPELLIFVPLDQDEFIMPLFKLCLLVNLLIDLLILAFFG